MKPNFALNLSHDGIGLLHRGKGGWELLGEVALDAPDFGDRLTALRRLAKARAPEGVTTKLVVPASQILYTEIEAPGPQASVRRTQIAAALEGMTPYAVEDLVFDWSGHEDVVQVAVVARETLTEAEAFAEDCGFCPVSFVAVPEAGQFKGEPWFGATAMAPAHLPQGARIERDQDPLPLANLPAATAESAATVPDAVGPLEAVVSYENPAAAALTEQPAAPAPTETAADRRARRAQKAKSRAAAEPAPETAPMPIGSPDAESPTAEQDLAAPAEAAPQAEAVEPASVPVLDIPLELMPVAQKVDEAQAEPAEVVSEVESLPEAPQSEPLAPEALATEECEEQPLPPPEPLVEASLEAPSIEDIGVDQPPAEADVAAPEAEAEPETRRDPELVDLDQLAALHIEMPGVSAVSQAAEAPAGDLDWLYRASEGEVPQAAPEAPTAKAPIDPEHADLEPMIAPKPLGGVARPGAPVAPPRRLPPAGKAGVSAPGLSLPWENEIAALPAAPGTGERLRKAAGSGLRKAAQGTLALGTSAGKAIAKARQMRPRVEAQPNPDALKKAAGSEKTVFGTRKPKPIGGKPKYMGPTLVAGLVGFLAIAALWSSFIETPTAPATTRSAEIAPPVVASTEVATLPPQDSAPPSLAAAPVTATPEASLPGAAPPVSEAPAVVTAPVAPLPAETTAGPAARDSETTASFAAMQGTLSSAQIVVPSLPILPPPGSAAAPMSQLTGTAPAAQSTAASTPTAQTPAPAAQELQPTAEGTLAPGGFTLYDGKPPRVSRPRPASVKRAAAEAAAEAAAPPGDPALARYHPKPRPASVSAAAAAATSAPAPATPPEAVPPPEAAPPSDDGALLAPGLSTRTAAVLQRAHPKPRPASVSTAAQSIPETPEAVVQTAAAAFPEASAASLSTSRRPMTRPRNFTASVDRALAAAIAAEPPPPQVVAAAAAPVEPVAPVKPQKPVRAKPSPPPEPTVVPGPDVETGEVESRGVTLRQPTVASVAKQATERNALDLGEIALIGLYGTPNNRRALVRMPNGRFVKLGVGDRLDGGRVTAIGDDKMTYQKGGRPVTLKMLRGG